MTGFNGKRVLARTMARELTADEVSMVSGGTSRRTYYTTNVGPRGDRDYYFDFD